MTSNRLLRRPESARRATAVSLIRACEPLEPRTLLATFPAGFADVQLSAGLTSPTALDIAPDGRAFVAQQDGTIRILQDDQLLATPFANLSAAVDGSSERGMLGITLDPNFQSNGYVYVYYTAKTPATHNRLSRLTAAGNTMVAGSETVLVDFPNIGGAIWHMGGAIHFGPDGKLYVGVGDHQQPNNSQSLSSVFGKLLRFNADGSIPTDNPFYNTTTGINRSIWNYGLRNPFTFAFDPAGRLFINDVGDAGWEEINESIKGANYGWPATEGDFNQASFPNFTRPLYAYSHALGQCIAGAAFYSPANPTFPAQYLNKFFFVDFSTGFMKTLDRVSKAVSNFATGLSFPTDAHVSPNGSMYYLQRNMDTGTPTAGSGSIRKLSYTANLPPTILEQPTGQAGAVGQSVTFSVAAFGTAPLSHQWRRNGADIPGANDSSYTRTVQANDEGALFSVHISNGAGDATSDAATLLVLPGTAPMPVIDLPQAGTLWVAGQTINFSGGATDADDGVLSAAALTWQVDYITGNVSRPLLLPTSGVTGGSVTIPDTSPYTSTTVKLRFILTATDSVGAKTTVTRDLLPQTSTPIFTANVAGVPLSLDGTPHAAPSAIGGVVGLKRELSAPASYSANGITYQFVSWSDGGDRVHQIAWPASAQTYIATYAVQPQTYASDLTPTAQSNGWGPYERDRSNGETGATDGRTITLNGVTYTKGLGVHAAASLTYALGGQYTAFMSDIGVDDEVGAGGSVVFQVFVDNVKVFDSGTMTGSSATQQINVSLQGAQTLRLVVTDSGNGNTSDHADWANARLIGAGTIPPLPIFGPATQYATATNSHGVATADLNGDGKLDLAVANAGSASVSVLLGNGDGSFGSAVNYTVGAEPKSVQIADLNLDGKPDLVTANQGNGTVSVLINNGNGTFAPAVGYAATSGAHEVALADLNNDSRPDIAVVGWGASTLRVLFNQGNGTFGGATNYAVGGAPHSVIAADFTGDDRPDLAVANRDGNSVSVLLNNGTGTFASASSMPVGNGPHSIRFGDFNSDGRIDLATANEGSHNVSVLLGNGNGTFTTAQNVGTGLVPKGVAVGDVNGDGKPDIVTANTAGNYPNSNNPGGDTISVLLGNGDGSFAAATTYTTGRTPFSVVLADIDGDGDLDAASANWHTNDVAVLKNLTNTAPPPPPQNQPPVTTADSAVTGVGELVVINVLANDSDLDGSLDASSVSITTQPLHGTVAVNPTTGAVTYTPVANYTGSDEFFYMVKDDAGAVSNPTKVSITVAPVQTETFVSDLTPTAQSNGWGPFERDRSNGEIGAADGRVITLNGVTYAKGLGTHANSSITYGLNGQYTQFLADVGMDDEVGSNGSVVFQVFVDDVKVFDSGTMTGASTTQGVNVNVVGASTLRLVVTDAGNGNGFDHADWANARLVVGQPTPPPAAPSSLTATVNGNAIDLVWVDESSDETGFRIERKTGAGGTWAEIGAVGANVHAFTDTAVSADTTYFYRVYAVNSGGPSAFSNDASATTPPLPPPPPPAQVVYLSDLTPTAQSNGWGPFERDRSNGEIGASDGRTITLNGVTYAKGLGTHANSSITYAMNGQYARFLADIGLDDEVGNNGSAVFQVFVDNTLAYDSGAMTGASATKQLDINVAGATSLRLVVTDGGNGNGFDHADWAGARLTAGQAPTAPPAAPTNLAAAYDGTRVTLTWVDASSDESGFRIQRRTGVAGNWADIGTAPVNAESFIDNGPLAPATTYYYQVIATNSAGDSTPSNDFFIETNAAPTEVWLSDLNWTSASNGWGNVERDRSNGEVGAADGRTLTINGVTYSKGLGVHANSSIVYNLGGQYTQFISDIGIDDEVGSNGSAIFRVYVDEVLAYDSGLMRGTDAAKQIAVSVAGALSLRLVVDSGGNGNAFDHADWAGAKLLS